MRQFDLTLPPEFDDLSPRRRRQIEKFLHSKLEEVRSACVDDCMDMLLAVPVLVLHDKFQFGKIKLNRFLSGVHTWIKAIHDDENTLAEVVKTAMDEADYVLDSE